MTKDEQNIIQSVSQQNEQLKSQLMATSVLTEITKVMLATPNLEAVFKTLMLGVQETMGFERIVLFKILPEEFSLRPVQWLGLEDAAITHLRVPLGFMGGGELVDTIFLNRPILVDPATPDDPTAALNPKSYLALPIVTKIYNRCWDFQKCTHKECPANENPNPYCWSIKGGCRRFEIKDEDNRRHHCVTCPFFKCQYVLWMDKPGAPTLATSDDITILTTLANQAGIIIDNFQTYENLEKAHSELKQINIEINKINRELKLAQSKINRDLEQAQTIQQGLLPQTLPQTDFFTCAATYIPATKVGGDYYDLFEVGQGCYCVLVADVSGHGIAAALVMSMAKILIKSNANAVSAKETIDKINKALNQDIKNDNFITMFYAVINFPEKKIIYSSAGHNPVLLINRDTRELQTIKADGIFLGVFDDAMVKDNVLPLQKGQRLILYTDGLTEAENVTGEMYTYERLAELAQRTVQIGPEEVQTEIMKDLKAHIGNASIEDDVTLLILDFN